MAKHKHQQKSPRFRSWYLLVLAAVFAGLAVYGLRSNFAHMVELRQQVYVADKAGRGVDQALQELRDFVGHHMNTDLSAGESTVHPPIQLKHTYDRLIRAKSEQTNDYNARIYTAAQDYCERKIPNAVIGKYRIDCIEEYVADHDVSTTYISADLYKFDFYSPRWSPDLAGLSIVAAVLCVAGFITLVVMRRLFR